MHQIDDSAINDETILKCRDFKDAVRFCIEVCSKERKEVAYELGMEESHLSRVLSNNPEERRHFPTDKFFKLMDICGNEIPLRWLALKRGYGLRKLRSVLEEEVEKLRKELAEKRTEMDVIKSFVARLRQNPEKQTIED